MDYYIQQCTNFTVLLIVWRNFIKGIIIFDNISYLDNFFRV